MRRNKKVHYAMQADISLSKRLTSSIGKKIVVALTGVFLSLFLIIHLMGNLQLLKNDGGEAFNHYAEFMGHNPLIQFVSKINFAFILGHAFWGIFLAFKNRAARPTLYAVNKPGANSRWASRNMALLGTIIFVFIAVHLSKFWFVFHYGDIPFAEYHDGVTGEFSRIKDYATVVDIGFEQLWIVIFYVASMFALAFHLSHGVQSAFQTLGLNNKEFAPTLRTIGTVFAYGICALFAIIPVLMYLNITL
ncbi:MAG: succinate dehydrogenase cytochrome b subunit [Sphingobacteriales bacterium JAD_PAG50586_3]|nr:MAG: succinate dehydrogenase cytochrome b subunit [Sphingobacteriales bacterium JAD_PAG50586_3]